MTDIKYTQQILDKSIPDFIRQDYPLFVEMMRAYYDWMAERKNTIDIVNSNYRDIDKTLDEFLEYFRQEYLVNIPFSANIDKRLLVKHIREFYNNKGNEQSYRFLFRLLYGEDIEFYYPKVDILKASDGKWQQTVSIKLLYDPSIPIPAYFSNDVIGLTSNALGKVENISTYTERGIEVYELSLQSLRGAFVANEQVQIGTYTAQVLEVVAGLDIISGGTGYKIGEKIEIKDGSTVLGTGKVLQVGRGPVTGLTLVDGGTGYNGTIREIYDFIYLPIGSTWEGTFLPSATIQGNSDQYDFMTSPISFPIVDTTIPGIGDVIRITDTPTQVGQNAIGVVRRVTQTGEILEIELLNGGRDYAGPVASVVSLSGTGAVVTADGGAGTIVAVSLDQYPVVVLDSNGEEIATINILTQDGQDADLQLRPNGGTIRYPGFWLNDDGKLSSTKVLQDNYYYQEFSYVILSSISADRWKEIVENVVHPSGFEFFGEIKVGSQSKSITQIGAQTTITTS